MRDFTRPASLTTSATPLASDVVAKTKPAAVVMQSVMAGLDGSASAIPIALGSVAVVYAKFPPEYLAFGVFATLLAFAVIQFVSGLGGRPMVFSARLFEATTLAAMLDTFVLRMPAWGLQPEPQILLALLCIVGFMAASFCAMFYLLRADRFTRLIPAPVYSGFAISIAVLLLLSQLKALTMLWQGGHSALTLLSICAVAIVVSLAVRHFRPRLPASAIGLFAGALVGLIWVLGGAQISMVMVAGKALHLPYSVANFSALASNGVQYQNLLPTLFYSGFLLGLMTFISSTVASETISQVDDRHASRLQHASVSISAAAGALMGSAPVSATQHSSLSASRFAPLDRRVAWIMAAVCLVIAVSGALNVLALAALAGVMLADAFFMADRRAIFQGWQWLRGRSLQTSEKEDLGLIAAVAVSAVLFNAVLAVLVGLLSGLLLFAVRNAKKPVRYTWTGEQVHSNCARGRAEITLLAKHGGFIKVLELEGELFFGAVQSLDRRLRESLDGAKIVILDWSRVRHVDSSIALSVQRWQRASTIAKVSTLHAGCTLQNGNACVFLAQSLPDAILADDLDRALEIAENTLLANFGHESVHLVTAVHEAVSLLKGVNEPAKSYIESLMPQQFYKSGDVLFRIGDVSDSLLLVLQGSAGVIVRNDNGHDVRLTSVRRGGVIGEVGFLDGALRSATVVAQEELLVAVLSRGTFNSLRESHPNAVYQVLVNLTLDLSVRLRHTTKLAAARSAGT